MYEEHFVMARLLYVWLTMHLVVLRVCVAVALFCAECMVGIRLIERREDEILKRREVSSIPFLSGMILSC